jgi:hypothetical protein
MNFALLVSNLPDIYHVHHVHHVHHVQYALKLPAARAPSLIKRMFSHLLNQLQHH